MLVVQLCPEILTSDEVVTIAVLSSRSVPPIERLNMFADPMHANTSSIRTIFACTVTRATR